MRILILLFVSALLVLPLLALPPVVSAQSDFYRPHGSGGLASLSGDIWALRSKVWRLQQQYLELERRLERVNKSRPESQIALSAALAAALYADKLTEEQKKRLRSIAIINLCAKTPALAPKGLCAPPETTE